MSVEKIFRELKKLTDAERSTVLQHLLEIERREDLHVLHEAVDLKLHHTDQLAKIESQVKTLSQAQQEDLVDWLENLLEYRLELKEEFKAEIEAGKKDIVEGRVRIRKP